MEDLSTGLRPQRSNSMVMLPSLGASRECRTPASDGTKRMRSEDIGERLCMHCHMRPSPSWPAVALCLCRESIASSQIVEMAAMDIQLHGLCLPLWTGWRLSGTACTGALRILPVCIRDPC